MKPSLLQRVDNGDATSASTGGLRFVVYLMSVVIAFFAGEYFAHIKTSPIVPAPAPLNAVSEPIPSAEPSAQNPAAPAVSATLASEPTASVAPAIRIEKAIPVAPATSVAVFSATQPQGVTILEPVEIPVKQGGKIVGYINLQRGQQVTPIAVEHDRIKIKCGANFVFVPIKATDLAH